MRGQRHAGQRARALGHELGGRRRALGVRGEQREGEAVEGGRHVGGERGRGGGLRGRLAAGQEQVEQPAERAQVVGGGGLRAAVGDRGGAGEAGAHHERPARGVEDDGVGDEAAVGEPGGLELREGPRDVGGDEHDAGLRHPHGGRQERAVRLRLDVQDGAVRVDDGVEHGREARVARLADAAQEL
ncbi:MAG: hypothetical protein ACKOSO_03405, partial [Actinomycetota bacterium]